MENEIFGISTPFSDLHPAMLDGTALHMSSPHLLQFENLSNADRQQGMTSSPLFSMMIDGQPGLGSNSAFVDFGTVSQENIGDAFNSPVLQLPPEDPKRYPSNDSSSTMNTSLSTSVDCMYETQDNSQFFARQKGDSLNGEDFDQNLAGKRSSTVRPSYHVSGGSIHKWLLDGSSLSAADLPLRYYTNELSLSLGYSQASAVDVPEDECLKLSQDNPEDSMRPLSLTALGKVLTVGGETSIDCSTSELAALSNMLSKSKYHNSMQEILAEVVTYALHGMNDVDGLCSARDSGELSFSSDCSMSADMCRQRPSFNPRSKKLELMSCLQMIDHGYEECMKKMHSVITSFHTATTSGSIHAPLPLALYSISAAYNNLRGRIAAWIITSSNRQDLHNKSLTGKVSSFESSFIQKQWALQQMKSEHQSWRPQRGLPEKSVSVLRAWMFQNFLHPYPKDHEKQLLAIKSGLSRSQVSNWFINARVRLWKPMIEEMYTELNKKNMVLKDGTMDPHSIRRIGGQRNQTD